MTPLRVHPNKGSSGVLDLKIANDSLRAEVEALREDRAMLDFVESQRIGIIPCFGLQPPMGSGLQAPFEGFVTDTMDEPPKPLRDAIRAAMRKEGE